MQTLALISGDLALAQGGYRLYNGVDRIRQDLTLSLMEEYGTDRFHPRWGSIIMRYIGSVITPQLEMLVRAEVIRILQNYIAIQQAEVLRDSQVDVKNRFNTSDVVQSVDGVSASTYIDRIDIQLALRTLARETVVIKKQVSV